jgi:hypothetical protein
LRLDFQFRCVYCLAVEAEVGPSRPYGGFEIEHFRPRSTFPKDENNYKNLLWACPDCNRAKSNTWPTRIELRNGSRFIDPCREALGLHLELKGLEVCAVQQSAAGVYTIDELNLNSAVHRRRRLIRLKSSEFLSDLEALLAKMELEARPGGEAIQDIEKLKDQIREFRDDQGYGPPWDVPMDCHCAIAN